MEVMQNKNLVYLFLYYVCLFVYGCKNKKQNQLFTSLSSNDTGIDFSKNIDEAKLKGGSLNEFGCMGGELVPVNSKYQSANFSRPYRFCKCFVNAY